MVHPTGYMHASRCVDAIVGAQAEEFEEAARLRDKLQSHPENVARHARLRLEAQLQSAVASEDFKVRPVCAAWAGGCANARLLQ